MAYFEIKNPNLAKFWRVLQWKMLVYFKSIWSTLRPFGAYILCPFGIFYGYLVYFFRFGMLHEYKSGSPGSFFRSIEMKGYDEHNVRHPGWSLAPNVQDPRLRLLGHPGGYPTKSYKYF
jgi:hypothetical protein